MTPERAVELVSPTSELGVDLFKADLVITDFQELALPGILCLVTDIAGAIKSSNIRKQIEDIQQEYNQYSHTLLNGLIERITLNDIDMFVLIKLQLWYQEGEKLLIWTLTKASIVSAAEEDRIVFTFADEKKFTFEKLKISFGIDDELFLVNFPNNLTKYLIPSHVHPECLSDLIDCDLNLIKASLKMEITSRICYFMDSFDNLPHSSHFHENTILFAGSVALKPTSVPFQLKIFQSVRSRDGKTVFPANLTLEGRQFESLCNLSNNTDLAISSSKHELIRLISRSDHSIVYLSKGSGDELVVIKKSLQANNAERTFFEFLEACPEKCPFIESPQATEFDENIMVFKYHPDCVDLFHFIELNLQLTDSCVRQIFIQICLAVKFLHSHNVVHRDIKDENILIDQNTLHVRLIDFGTSSFIQPGSSGKFVDYVGTFAYAPVEALKGLPYDGFKQDIWCLGIVLYVLSYSSVPFNNAKESLQGFLRLPFSRPPSLVALIRRLLDPNPEKRPDIECILNSEYVLST